VTKEKKFYSDDASRFYIPAHCCHSGPRHYAGEGLSYRSKFLNRIDPGKEEKTEAEIKQLIYST
jgi:hypothetical protein